VNHNQSHNKRVRSFLNLYISHGLDAFQVYHMVPYMDKVPTVNTAPVTSLALHSNGTKFPTLAKGGLKLCHHPIVFQQPFPLSLIKKDVGQSVVCERVLLRIYITVRFACSGAKLDFTISASPIHGSSTLFGSTYKYRQRVGVVLQYQLNLCNG
jgi:hypothetical protein